jgi:hypothetical protein
MTPPHTPPATGRRGHRHIQAPRAGERLRLTGCVSIDWARCTGTVRRMPYPIDLTDEQWDMHRHDVAPFLPRTSTATLGRPRGVSAPVADRTHRGRSG